MVYKPDFISSILQGLFIYIYIYIFYEVGRTLYFISPFVLQVFYKFIIGLCLVL